MSFKNLEITGEIKETRTEVVQEVNATQISLDCGDERITLVGEIKRVIRVAGLSSAGAVKVQEPGKPAEIINSYSSPSLKDESGEPRPLVPGTTITPMLSGKAAEGDVDEEDVEEYEEEEEEEEDDSDDEEADDLDEE